jgi:hypothetical protein
VTFHASPAAGFDQYIAAEVIAGAAKREWRAKPRQHGQPDAEVDRVLDLELAREPPVASIVNAQRRLNDGEAGRLPL